MPRPVKALPVVFIVLVLIGGVLWRVTHETVEKINYQEPEDSGEFKLKDDRLADKNPAFDPTLVDSRPLGDWEVNKSAAVIKLDCPAVKPDTETHLLDLHASYAAVARFAEERGLNLLPSANMLDGAAKQFDDGLYAALDLACFRGELGPTPAAPDLIQGLCAKLPATSPAKPFLAAALELAGRSVALSPAETKKKAALLAAFERDKARSQPISFYNWTPELRQVWRFYRFLQREFGETELDMPTDLANVLAQDAALRQPYTRLNSFYGRLTNPLLCLPLNALIDAKQDLKELARARGARHAAVAVFPPSTSRETELFERLFGDVVPPGVNLMNELIRRVRSGEVDFTPDETDGWYQYQVYALEVLLLPAKGDEHNKLLLTARYKKRLVETFKALMTKRRETHARQLGLATLGCADIRHGEVRPRLRVEPCATFYLRTARAYGFLANLLQTMLDDQTLRKLHGLKKDGHREHSLGAELNAMCNRFHGFYLVACEDIGMNPRFLAGEQVDRQEAKGAALAWLTRMKDDPDLARDTRVAVPIAVDLTRHSTRLWATLGVRLAHLEASYARPPKVRPKDGGDWQEPEHWMLSESRYVIAVDEFAEFAMPGSDALTRDEFRKLCDRHKTKDQIVNALKGR
ncbi:MAG: hypothetical protein JXR37_06115 [Kiritimatiellae bacterium]|nr:hypothetical protein [Kiritimatiellia bacterium]